MITSTCYLKSNITIEAEVIGADNFYIYNYKGIHYRVFKSSLTLNQFLNYEHPVWFFECNSERELDLFLINQRERRQCF